MDYALDLKNFHETSQLNLIAPILIATNARPVKTSFSPTVHRDKILAPIKENGMSLGSKLRSSFGNER